MTFKKKVDTRENMLQIRANDNSEEVVPSCKAQILSVI